MPTNQEGAELRACIDHLCFVGKRCPDCGLDVDAYGNTEAQFDNCCFPDCGCDGARLCMAGKASDDALNDNVEGMWSGKSREQIRARVGMVKYATRTGEKA